MKLQKKVFHYQAKLIQLQKLINIHNRIVKYIENKSITMMRGKSPPPEHNNIHVTENYKYNQLRES